MEKNGVVIFVSFFLVDGFWALFWQSFEVLHFSLLFKF